MTKTQLGNKVFAYNFINKFERSILIAQFGSAYQKLHKVRVKKTAFIHFYYGAAEFIPFALGDFRTQPARYAVAVIATITGTHVGRRQPLITNAYERIAAAAGRVQLFRVCAAAPLLLYHDKTRHGGRCTRERARSLTHALTHAHAVHGARAQYPGRHRFETDRICLSFSKKNALAVEQIIIQQKKIFVPAPATDDEEHQ